MMSHSKNIYQSNSSSHILDLEAQVAHKTPAGTSSLRKRLTGLFRRPKCWLIALVAFTIITFSSMTLSEHVFSRRRLARTKAVVINFDSLEESQSEESSMETASGPTLIDQDVDSALFGSSPASSEAALEEGSIVRVYSEHSTCGWFRGTVNVVENDTLTVTLTKNSLKKLDKVREKIKGSIVGVRSKYVCARRFGGERKRIVAQFNARGEVKAVQNGRLTIRFWLLADKELDHYRYHELLRTSDEVRESWGNGSKVEVWSSDEQRWLSAEITRTAGPSTLRVEFCQQTKFMSRFDDLLRAPRT